jgi:hypothetical protein
MVLLKKPRTIGHDAEADAGNQRIPGRLIHAEEVQLGREKRREQAEEWE